MGSCSVKRVSEPKPIKNRVHMTPITSGSANPLHFPFEPKSDPIFSQYFEAFGGFPDRFELAFTQKPVEFRGNSAFEVFDNNKVAVSCTKGLKESVNQDNFCIVSSLAGVIVGVFDGHGDDGHIVASEARKTVASKIEEFGFQAISEAFLATNEEIVKKCEAKKANCQYSGCTATVVTIFCNTLTAAHIGDSRALLVKSYQNRLVSVPLTIDHKPSDFVEQHRIKNAGGFIMKTTEEDILRVFIPDSPLGLAITRSFGDKAFEKFGVTCSPAIRKVTLEPNDRFLVVATDGVWDVIENYEISAVLEKLECKNACERISKLARDRWIASGTNTVDDITIVILPLNVT